MVALFNPLASVRDTRIPSTLRDLGAAKFAILEMALATTGAVNFRVETVFMGGPNFQLGREGAWFTSQTSSSLNLNPNASIEEAMEQRERAYPTASYAQEDKITHVWVFDAAGNGMSLSQIGISAASRPTLARALDDAAEMSGSGGYGSYELTERLYNSLLWGTDEARQTRALQPWDTMPTDTYPSEDVVDLYTQGADALGAKLIKRIAKLSAPTVANAFFNRPLRVKVLPANPALDGWIVIHPRIAIEAQKAAKGVSDRQTKATKDKIKSNVAFNGITIGHMEDQHGNRLNAMLKGQHVVCQNAQMMGGYDIITSADNVKEEMFATCENLAVVAMNPQGPKEFRLDGQTLVNSPQFFPHEELVKAFHREFDQLRDAFVDEEDYSMIITDDKIIQILENIDDPDLGETFTTAMNWRVTNWFVSDLDPKMSPFIYESMGRMITQRYFWDRRAIRKVMGGAPARSAPWFSRLGVPVPNSRRAQVISVSAAHLVGVKSVVPNGWPEWSERLGMMVFSDEDYVDVIQPSHGGSDLDDFYGLLLVHIPHPDRVVGYDHLRADHNLYLVVVRNPNTTGEYSVWPARLDRMYELDRDESGSQIPFIEPETFWRPQILDAQASGHLTIHPLDPDPATAMADIKRHITSRMGEIVDLLKARGPLSVLDEILYRRLSVDARKKIHQGAPQAPKAMASLTEDQKPNFARIKHVIGVAMSGFWDEVEAVSQNSEPNQALLDLFSKPSRDGLSVIKADAASSVKSIRSAARNSLDRKASEITSPDEGMRFWFKEEERLVYSAILRNRFATPIREINSEEWGVAVYNALRLWLGFLVQPTKNGRISDRAIMASDENFSLLTYALTALGFTRGWYPTSGEVEAELEKGLWVYYWHPQHPSTTSDEVEMEFKCRVCGKIVTVTDLELALRGFRTFISTRGVCSDHR